MKKLRVVKKTGNLKTDEQSVEERNSILLERKQIVGGIVLALLVTVLFAVSVHMRSDYKGYVSQDHHHHLTATSMIFTNCWLEDGIFADHFAMMANPDSVEFSCLKDRSFYDSYPSGCIVPLYLLAKITGKSEINYGFIQGWNLFNQYMVTLFLVAIVYIVFLRIRAGVYTSVAVSIIPAVVNLFSPAPFYFFHSVYFADIAVLLPFVMTVFLEIIIPMCPDRKIKRYLKIAEAVIIFAGTVTDYLYLCLIFVIYIKKLLLGEISFKSPLEWFKDSLIFGLPAIIGICLFILQIVINGPVRILDMFFFRTGMNDESGWTQAFPTTFWKDYIVKGYGENADIIIKASLIIVVGVAIVYAIMKVSKKYTNPDLVLVISTAAMIIIPCFMQVYLLKNHSAIHDFSTLKFSLVMSVVPFVLLPAMYIIVLNTLLKGNGKSYLISLTSVAYLVVVSVAGCTYQTHVANAASYFPEPTTEYETVGNFIKSNTDYNDVIFSQDYVITDSNDYPGKLAYSKKRIYQITDVSEIVNKVSGITQDYTINIFSYGGPITDGVLAGVTAQAYEVKNDGNMYLYKIDKSAFGF